jgi:hypothetical protein
VLGTSNRFTDITLLEAWKLMLHPPMAMLLVGRYTNGNLLAVMDSCGKLGFDGKGNVHGEQWIDAIRHDALLTMCLLTLGAADDMLLDKVTTRLLTSIHDLSATELHSMVGAVALFVAQCNLALQFTDQPPA